MFERIAIAGVGLIGGSLALAARAAGLVKEVVGLGRTEANLAIACERGIVDRSTTDPGKVGNVDLVVLAVPVRSIASTAQALAPHLAPGTVITDVASVKGAIVRDLESIFSADRPVVGAHPIAGTERSGAAAADAELFRGRRCVITPTPRTDAGALLRVESLWRGVGAVVERMTPGEHDQALAWTSHAVHAIAYTLARTIAERDSALLRLAGPSLRDATRVAGSNPDLWVEILLANADAVRNAVAVLRAELGEIESALKSTDEGRLADLLRRGHRATKLFET